MRLRSAFVIRLTLLSTSMSGVFGYAATLELPDVVVQQPEQQLDDKTGFSITETANQAASSVVDAIQQHPMVQVLSHSSNPAAQTIALHGFSDNASSNSLYLLDETPYVSASLVGPNLNAFLPDAISQYILLPGSYGVLYGNQAIAGVVKLATEIPHQPVAQLELSLGNMNQFGVGFIASERDDNGLGMRLGGTVYNNNHDQPDADQQDYIINLQWVDQSDNASTDVRVAAYNTTINIPAALTWGSEEQPSTSDKVNVTQGYLLQANRKQRLTDDWQWFTHVLWLDDNQTSTSLNSNSDQSSIMWKNDWLYTSRWQLGWVLNVDIYKTDNSKASYDSDEYLTSAYARYTHPLTSSLSLVTGARYAWQGIGATSSTDDSLYQHNTAFVNEESLYWQPMPEWQFFLRRDMNFRMPKGKEEVWSADGTVHQLAVQTGTAYETGFNWSQSNNTVHLGIFHLDIDNELSYTLLPLPYGEVTNLPPTRRQGIDASLDHVWSDKWSSGFELSWVNPTLRSGQYAGNQIPGVSRFNGGVRVTLKPSLQSKLSLLQSYHSGFYASDDFDNSGDKMPGYWLTGLRYQRQWQKVAMIVRADNLFDEQYVRYAQYYSDGTIKYYPADGRSILATLKFNLG